MNILTTLNLPIHEHHTYIFQFIGVVFNLLHQYFKVVRVWVFCLISWIVFLISLSDSSLLVYRFPFPAGLLNSLMSSRNFLVVSFGFLFINMPLANSDCFPFLFGFVLFFLFDYCGRTYTMLNKNGENVHPWLVPDFRGRTLSFSPLNMKSASGLTAIVLLSIPSILTLLRVFIINVTSFFLHLLSLTYDFYPLFC